MVDDKGSPIQVGNGQNTQTKKIPSLLATQVLQGIDKETATQEKTGDQNPRQTALEKSKSLYTSENKYNFENKKEVILYGTVESPFSQREKSRGAS